jgi:hypothetical protein
MQARSYAAQAYLALGDVAVARALQELNSAEETPRDSDQTPSEKTVEMPHSEAIVEMPHSEEIVDMPHSEEIVEKR